MTKKLLVLFGITFLVFFLAILIVPLPLSLNKDYSRVIYFSDGSIMRAYLTKDEKYRFFCPLKKIDPLLIKATLCYEDKYFYYHPGVNPVAILRALFQNISSGRIVSGASTITMQVAKIMEPKKRTVLSKIIEMFRAFQLEAKIGKQKILEYYFNHAPYGGNIEGVFAASWFYFHKKPDHLSIDEIAYLVSLPKSPESRKPQKKNKQKALKGRNAVLKKMFECGIIGEENFKTALLKDVPQEVKGFDANTFHAADFIAQNHPETKELHSTIDRNIQKTVSKIVSTHQKRLMENGIDTISVVVIENKTGKIRSLIGSFNYFDKNSGQVKGFLAKRSTGSALKPFLFLFAIKKGLILPDSLLPDIPQNFSGYEPHNFHDVYQGLIKAKIALSESKNLPFIYLLKEVGTKDFLDFLEKIGLKFDKKIGYGLSLIVGGLEVNLLNLTSVYSTLANMGKKLKPVILEGKTDKGSFVFNRGEAYLTIKALGLRGNPEALRLKKLDKIKVYFKTGTSHGRRDAIAIGFNTQFTVGVWCGKISGRGNENITGTGMSLPVVFDILGAITTDFKDYEKGDFLKKISVCKFSGYLDNGHCDKLTKVFAPSNRTLIKSCPFHKSLWIEKKSGFRACPYKTYKKGEVTEVSKIVLPERISMFLNAKKYALPKFSPECQVVKNQENRKGVTITTVGSHKTYVLTGDKNFNKIVLRAKSSVKNSSIFWFVNNNFIGQTKNGSDFVFTPPEGKVSIVAIDSWGNEDSVNIFVKYLK